MDTLVVAAVKSLVELGLLEDSGLRRPNKAGVMQVVWRLSPLGELVSNYQKQFGLTWEQALEAAQKRQ